MNKKVLITGGAGDIAVAIAKEFEKNGQYDVYIPSRQELDVTDRIKANEYISNIKPDILINNAGAIKIQGIAENDMETQLNVINVNLTGVFICTGAALKNNPDAKIVNIGSSAAKKVHGNWSSYCATKAAVVMATACWAEEGIDTICISPGRASTKMRKGMYPDEDQSTLMQTEDFAKAVHNIIMHNYKKGDNIDINVSNVEEFF